MTGLAPNESKTVMPLADRSMKARKRSVCPLCGGPVLVGQSISRVGFWAHTSCVVAARQVSAARAEEERLAAADGQLPRCKVRGCAARFWEGPDRLCADHRQDDGGLPGPYASLMADPAGQAIRAGKVLWPDRLSASPP